MASAVECGDLRKVFRGGHAAIDGLTFSVEPGSVYGLIGRNGSGKTTALRILMGLLNPDQGEAKILGYDMRKAPLSIRGRVAYVSQGHQLPAWMTPSELCYYVSHFYDRWSDSHARELARRLEVAWEEPVGQMSGGGQQKVAILLACAAAPEVLILDEPAAALDAIARRQLVQELESYVRESRRCTVLFCTHIVSDLERVADYIGVIDGGRMIAEARLEDWQDCIKGVQVRFLGSHQPPVDFAIPGALRSVSKGPVIQAIVHLTSESQLQPLEARSDMTVTTHNFTLEESFVQLLGRPAADDQTSKSRQRDEYHQSKAQQEQTEREQPLQEQPR